jgi:hypothetical protein
MKTIEYSHLGPELAESVIAETEEGFVILKDGKPSGYLLLLPSEDDLLDYELTSDPRFQARVAEARQRFKVGRGVSVDDAKKRLGIE